MRARVMQRLVSIHRIPILITSACKTLEFIVAACKAVLDVRHPIDHALGLSDTSLL